VDTARVLAGDNRGDRILCPGPGRCSSDRSLEVMLHEGVPDGFLLHSSAGDEPSTCLDHMRRAQRLAPSPLQLDSSELMLDQQLTVSRCLADVTPEPVEWLWPGRIALGKLGLMAGAPGLGKSQLAAAMVAAVTTGGRWPDGRFAPYGS